MRREPNTWTAGASRTAGRDNKSRQSAKATDERRQSQVAPLSQRADALILISTPAGRLSLFKASIVLAVA